MNMAPDKLGVHFYPSWQHSNNKPSCDIIYLYRLFVINNDESWKCWNLGDYSGDLEEEASTLLDFLQGKSPFSARSKDKQGWGSGSGKYTAAAGYSAILEFPWVPSNPGPWKALWNFPSIPKVDIFIWTLLHNNILTSEILKRKG